jgi:flagellar protein FliS
MNPYFEQVILSASPVELVRLMYQNAIASVADARDHLKAGRIRERGQAINKAYAILAELLISLDSEKAPELAANLKRLYCYMQERLIEANLRQKDEPLAETGKLLRTLADAWLQVPETRGHSGASAEFESEEESLACVAVMA